jgi:hypothetical protein
MRVTKEEITLSISSLKSKSAPGVDGICREMLKRTANIVAEYLVGYSMKFSIVDIFLIHGAKT